MTLVFGSEEKAREFGLDWSRAEEVYEHHHDDECCGGHDDPDHECCGRHDHHHHEEDEYLNDDYPNDFMGFSSN